MNDEGSVYEYKSGYISRSGGAFSSRWRKQAAGYARSVRGRPAGVTAYVTPPSALLTHVSPALPRSQIRSQKHLTKKGQVLQAIPQRDDLITSLAVSIEQTNRHLLLGHRWQVFEPGSSSRGAGSPTDGTGGRTGGMHVMSKPTPQYQRMPC